MQTENKVTATLKSDIKLSIRLIGETQGLSVNIQSVNAYFVHRDSRKETKELKKYFKFMRRYPIEPCVNDLRSTICCLNNPGIYGYNTRPVGTCMPVYAGFGVEPIEKRPKPVLDVKGVIKAPIYYTADRSTVEVYFPAYAQKKTGDYDLILNMKLYDTDYSFGNYRIVTIKYDQIVTLTNNSLALPDGIGGIEIIPCGNSLGDPSQIEWKYKLHVRETGANNNPVISIANVAIPNNSLVQVDKTIKILLSNITDVVDEIYVNSIPQEVHKETNQDAPVLAGSFRTDTTTVNEYEGYVAYRDLNDIVAAICEQQVGKETGQLIASNAVDGRVRLFIPTLPLANGKVGIERSISFPHTFTTEDIAAMRNAYEHGYGGYTHISGVMLYMPGDSGASTLDVNTISFQTPPTFTDWIEFPMPALETTVQIVYQNFGAASPDRYVTSGNISYTINPNNNSLGTNLILDVANTNVYDDVYVDMSNIADWYEEG